MTEVVSSGPCDYWRETFPRTRSLLGIRHRESVLWATFMSVAHWQLSGQERNLGVLTQPSFCWQVQLQTGQASGKSHEHQLVSRPFSLSSCCDTADTIISWGLGMCSFVCSVSLKVFFFWYESYFLELESLLFSSFPSTFCKNQVTFHKKSMFFCLARVDRNQGRDRLLLSWVTGWRGINPSHCSCFHLK